MELEKHGLTAANVKTTSWFKLITSLVWINNMASLPLNLLLHSKELITHNKDDGLKVFWDGQLARGVALLNLNIIFWKKNLTNGRQVGKHSKDVERCSRPYSRNALEILGKSVYTRGKKTYGRHYNEEYKWKKDLTLCRSKKWAKDLERQTSLKANEWKWMIMKCTIYLAQS